MVLNLDRHPEFMGFESPGLHRHKDTLLTNKIDLLDFSYRWQSEISGIMPNSQKDPAMGLFIYQGLKSNGIQYKKIGRAHV